MILVDPEDQWLLDDYTWHVNDRGYVRRGLWDGRRVMQISLHHCIVGQPIWEGEEIDHINRNKLDNRRCNLRYATHSENMANHSRTGPVGVYQQTSGRYWASVSRDRIRYHLGTYDTIEEAVEARNKWIEEQAT